MANLPNADDLKKLPLRALLAYTARCTQRIQPFFRVGNSPEAQAAATAVSDAIRLGLNFASGVEIDTNVAVRIEEDVLQAVMLASEETRTNRRAAFTANSAYALANAAHMAILARDSKTRVQYANRALAAVVTAVDAADAADRSIRRAAPRDFAMLCKLGLGSFPEMGKPLDPSAKGPLGPLSGNAMPKDWNPAPAAPTVRHDNFAMEAISQERAELDVLRSKADADRLVLQQESEKFREKQQQLDGDRDALSNQMVVLQRERDELATMRAQLEADQSRLENERAVLQNERAVLQDDILSFHEEQSEFDRLRAQVDQDAEQTSAEKQQMRACAAELEQVLHKFSHVFDSSIV